MCGTPRPEDDQLFANPVNEWQLASIEDEEQGLVQCIAPSEPATAATAEVAVAADQPLFPSVAHGDSTFFLQRLSVDGDRGGRHARAMVMQEVGDRLAYVKLHRAGWFDFDQGRQTFLLPLRTIGDGNCLLHATSQALWGVQDVSRNLRSVLAQAFLDDDCAAALQARWMAACEATEAALPPEFRVCAKRVRSLPAPIKQGVFGQLIFFSNFPLCPARLAVIGIKSGRRK